MKTKRGRNEVDDKITQVPVYVRESKIEQFGGKQALSERLKIITNNTVIVPLRVVIELAGQMLSKCEPEGDGSLWIMKVKGECEYEPGILLTWSAKWLYDQSDGYVSDIWQDINLYNAGAVVSFSDWIVEHEGKADKAVRAMIIGRFQR